MFQSLSFTNEMVSMGLCKYFTSQNADQLVRAGLKAFAEVRGFILFLLECFWWSCSPTSALKQNFLDIVVFAVILLSQ